MFSLNKNVLSAGAFGLYIHLPWCVQKCPYCDFNSHPLHQSLPEDDYLKALLADLNFEAPGLEGRTIDSIFFGGGTPSLFSGSAIDKILHAVSCSYTLGDNIEITLEANPGTAESHRFADYFKAGVNRLSLGFQSMDNTMLRRLGRIHSVKESLAAFDMARQAGFGNINLDIMFGLPEQSHQQALDDLSAAIDLEPEHLSWYQLTLEPNTAFAQRPPKLPNSDAVFAMQEAGLPLLSEALFQRYEVSAFSKPGRRCKHNLNYWRFGDYLGIGAGAHSKLSIPEPTRFARISHPRYYMPTAGRPAVYQETGLITHRDLLFEFLLNQLRLTEGFDLKNLDHITGISKAQFLQIMQPAFNQGLLCVDQEQCCATEKGYRFLNDVLLLALPEQSR